MVRVPKYVVASAVMALGGLLFGLDTGCIGPVMTMNSLVDSLGAFSSTIHGVVVSAILIPAAVSSFFAGHMADRIGRRHTVSIGSVLFAIGTAIEAGSMSLGQLIGGRVIEGIGEGLFLSTIIVYICEIAPAKSRGVIASMVQFMTTIGILAGYFICYGTATIPSSLSWRLPFMIQAFLALGLAIGAPFLTESPRWLQAKGRIEQLQKALQQLELPPEELEAAVESEKQQVGLLGSFKKGVRKQTWLGVFLMAMAQFSGIDGVLYYAPVLFSQAGLSNQQASFLASGISGVLIVASTIPASICCDRWGRRISTLIGGIAIAGCMTIIGSLYAANQVFGDYGAGRWVVIICIYLFVIAYSMTWAVVFKIYTSEIQPAATRAASSSLAQAANWFANWIVAFTTPIFLAHSSSGPYFLFAGCTFLTVIVCFFYMPESKGKSLEAVCKEFDLPGTRPTFKPFKTTTVEFRELQA